MKESAVPDTGPEVLLSMEGTWKCTLDVYVAIAVDTSTIGLGRSSKTPNCPIMWFFAAFLMQYKVSVKEMAKTAHVSYPTAFNIAKRLRRGFYLSQLQEKLKGIVELDEVYVTAGLKGKHTPFTSTAPNTTSSETQGKKTELEEPQL